MCGWVAGLALLLLIGFLIFAGSKNNSNNASSGSSLPTAASRTDTAEHHGLRLIIAAADHPGAIEELRSNAPVSETVGRRQ